MKSVLEIIQKHMLSIVCGVIAILAVVATAWPLGGYFAALQTKANAGKTENTALEGLLKKQRTLPVIDPNETTPKPLEMYPTALAITRARQVIDEVVASSTQVLGLVQKLNEHQLLVPGALPAGQTSFAVNYQDAYQKAVEFTSNDDSIRKETLPVRVLKAGIPPNDNDITAEKARRTAEIKSEKLVPGPNGNQVQVDQEIKLMQETLADEMRSAVANNSMMYINVDSLDVYPGVYNTSTPPVAATIYYSQIGLWVQQDVFEALARANAPFKNVTEAPVKHLIKIDVVEDKTSNTPTGFGGTNQPAPAADAAGASAAHSATGRSDNTIYSVVPFRLVMFVDARRIQPVLLELSRNKLITVLRCDISSVDSVTALLNGYYYGPVPVVQLTLDCESLLLKNWLSKFMPPSIAAPPTAAAGG